MSDSRHFRVMGSIGHGMDTQASFGSPAPKPWKLVNLDPDGGTLANFGGKQTLWEESWTPDGGVAFVYDWPVGAMAGLAATTHRIVADGAGRLYLESGYVGEYEGLYNPYDDPSVASTALAVAADSVTEYAGSLFVSGIGRPIYDSTSEATRFAPVALDGIIRRVTATVTANSASVTISGEETAWYGKSIRFGDRLTLTNGTTGVMETRTIVGYDSATHTLTADSAFASAYTGASAVVAGIHYVGIERHSIAPHVATQAGTLPRAKGTRLYKYTLAVRNTPVQDDDETNDSPTALRDLEGAGTPEKAVVAYEGEYYDVTLSGWGEIPVDKDGFAWGHYDLNRIHIYRTIADGDAFYLLTTLRRDESAWTFADTYLDQVSDDALSGSQDIDAISIDDDAADTNVFAIDGQPGTPRLINITITNKTSGTAAGNTASYTIVGVAEDGSAVTDVVIFTAGDLASVQMDKGVTRAGIHKMVSVTSITPSAAQPSLWKHSAGVESSGASAVASPNSSNILKNPGFELGASDGKTTANGSYATPGTGIKNWTFAGGASTKANNSEGYESHGGWGYCVELDNNGELVKQAAVPVDHTKDYVLSHYYLAPYKETYEWSVVFTFDDAVPTVIPYDFSTTEEDQWQPKTCALYNSSDTDPAHADYLIPSDASTVEVKIIKTGTYHNNFRIDDVAFYPASESTPATVEVEYTEYSAGTVYTSAMHQPAPALKSIRAYNNRLWGVNAHYDGYLQFSNLGGVEYWPLLLAAATADDKVADGGAIAIGNAGDRITGIIPEVGAYSTQGRTGSTLLTFTVHGASRLSGSDWNSFSLDEAYPVGCVAEKSIVNARGTIIWRSRDGVMACAAGGSQPQNVSEQIPGFFSPDIAQSATSSGGHLTVAASDSGASDVGVYWQGVYILACGGSGNPMALAYRPGAGWFGLSYITGVTEFHVAEGANGYGDLLWCNSSGIYRMSCGPVGGDHTTDGDASGNGSLGVPWKLLLGPVSNLKDSSLVGRVKVKRVLFMVETGDAATSVTLMLYPMGADWDLFLEDPSPLVDSDTGATTATKTVAAAPTGKKALRAIEWYPDAVCRYPALGIKGASTADFTIRGVQIDIAAVGSDDVG